MTAQPWRALQSNDLPTERSQPLSVTSALDQLEKFPGSPLRLSLPFHSLAVKTADQNIAGTRSQDSACLTVSSSNYFLHL